MKAAGGRLVDPEVAPNLDGWARIAAALDAQPGALEEFVAPDVTAVLRSWRPPRSKRGLTVFFTGLSGSGKSTLARGSPMRSLNETAVTLIDGDVARRLLSSGLGFSAADRELNVRRIGWVAAEVTKHGCGGLCADRAVRIDPRRGTQDGRGERLRAGPRLHAARRSASNATGRAYTPRLGRG